MNGNPIARICNPDGTNYCRTELGDYKVVSTDGTLSRFGEIKEVIVRNFQSNITLLLRLVRTY